MAHPRVTHLKVLAFALGLPGAYEDHPWDETVAKVNGKVFVFLGSEDDPEHLGMTVKLDESLEQALTAPGAHPSGYGLGKAGWATIPFQAGTPPLPVLLDWVEESYRRIAPRKLVAELDQRPIRR
jgi:predicted DNA-binding protein (MmcQ/YjbR family)